MATFRKRAGKWQARIQRKGYPDQTKTFSHRADALAWARMVESDIDRKLNINSGDAEKTTLGALLERYLHEITPNKKGAVEEAYRINAWLRHSMADSFIANLRGADFARWRDQRIQDGKSANTIRLDLAVISNVYTVAKTEWGFESITNPIPNIRSPKLPNGRTRRVDDLELELIISNTDSPFLPTFVILAVETGMRRGELARLEWQHVNFHKKTLWLPDTKNGHERTVPLSSKAIHTLSGLPKAHHGEIFGITAHAMTIAFVRACKRAGFEDLRFHDLRHEAISRFFERGLSLPEVAAISGHKTWAMLTRYTHLKVETFVEKLG